MILLSTFYIISVFALYIQILKLYSSCIFVNIEIIGHSLVQLIKLKVRQLIVECAGVLDDDGDSSAGATTKYPRHRSGCICIVCIQASSGKGRHSPPCITVKRRVDTLLARKKQLLGTQKDDDIYDGDEGDGACLSEKEGNINKGCLKKGELSAGQIDLNCRPDLDEDMQVDI